MTHPRAKLAGASAPPTLSDGRVTAGLAAAAATTLRGILAGVSSKGLAPDPLAAWEAFRRFAVLPVESEAPQRLAREGGDLLLCEWGVFEWPWSKESSEVFLVDLVRQFTVTAEDGEHDRVEQVHCSISFDPAPELRRLGSGTIWSGADPRQWFAEVEHSDAFVALRTAPAVEVHVVGERL